jgi:hypothetical protein
MASPSKNIFYMNKMMEIEKDHDAKLKFLCDLNDNNMQNRKLLIFKLSRLLEQEKMNTKTLRILSKGKKNTPEMKSFIDGENKNIKFRTNYLWRLLESETSKKSELKIFIDIEKEKIKRRLSLLKHELENEYTKKFNPNSNEIMYELPLPKIRLEAKKTKPISMMNMRHRFDFKTKFLILSERKLSSENKSDIMVFGKKVSKGGLSMKL